MVRKYAARSIICSFSSAQNRIPTGSELPASDSTPKASFSRGRTQAAAATHWRQLSAEFLPLATCVQNRSSASPRRLARAQVVAALHAYLARSEANLSRAENKRS